MKIFEVEQIREIDQYTIQNEPVSALDLMERAAAAFAHEIKERFPREMPVHVFAGPGDNGGDALAVARLLQDAGFASVCTYLFNPGGRLSPSCAANREFLRSRTSKRQFVEVEKGVRFDLPYINGEMLVVDGLFGTGLSRPLGGAFAAIVKFLNHTGATIVSIDLPSGLMAEDNTDNDPEHIVRASYTFTFQHPKLCFFFPETAAFLGKWEVLDIRLSPEAIRILDTPYSLVEREELKALVRPLSRFAHKGTQGHGLLVSGSRGMAGAALLSAGGALRSGLGKLTVHTPGANVAVLQAGRPEAVLSVDPSESCFSCVPEVEMYNAVAVGPGLGLEEETAEALADLLAAMPRGKPLVVDADGLNLIARRLPLLRKLPPGTILTPHPKELERILGDCQNAYARLQMARELAQATHVLIVLKGAYTATIFPDRSVHFNTTGNPGMATAGSGDVLTGVLLSLLAQGYAPREAALLGVYLHGLAGDLAAREVGMRGMTASDLVRFLPRAWEELEA